MSDQNERPLDLESDEPTAEEEEAEKEAEKVADEVTSAAAAARAASMLRVNLPKPQTGGVPPWVLLPEGFQFPRGKQVLFLRFRSEWTDAPWKGDPIIDPETGKNEVDGKGETVLYRQCIVWPINTADKKLALGRAQRDPNRAADELAKQMIRAADGVTSDWAVVKHNGVEMFWNELGERCRGLLQRIFTQLHVLDQESTQDFLTSCIEVRSTGS